MPMSDSNVPPHELEIPVDKEMADRISSQPELDDVSSFLVAGEDPLASMPMNGSLLQEVSEEEIKQKQAEFEQLVNKAQQELSSASEDLESKQPIPSAMTEQPSRPAQLVAGELSLSKEASNEETLSSMLEDLKDEASLFVNHTIAELALEAKGLAIFPYIDKKKIAEHKLAYQMGPFERFLSWVKQSRNAPLADEVILKGFVDSGVNLKGHAGKTPLLAELDVMPSDGSLGLTGVRINSYGPQVNKLSELDLTQLHESLNDAKTSLARLQARAGEYVEYTSQSTGFMQAMLKFTEGSKVSSAYQEHAHNIRALLELRSVMDMKGCDLSSFDRDINQTALFAPIFAKKHTKSWESFSQTLKKTEDLMSRIKRDMDAFLQSPKTQNKAIADKTDYSLDSEGADVPLDTAKEESLLEQTPSSNERGHEDSDMEYFGIKYRFQDKDIAQKLLSLKPPADPAKGFKFAHPEVPLIWAALKITNPELIRKDALLPHFLYIDDRLPNITNPGAQIMDFLTHGDEGIELSSYSFYKHNLSDLSCQGLPEAFRACGISSELIDDIKNTPAPENVSREYPFTDSPNNAIRKSDVLRHVPSDGRKLISPSLALAWECVQLGHKQTIESLTSHSLFGKKGPSTDALIALGHLDKFGQKITFPDCFYTDESTPDLSESGDSIVVHYIDLCREHGIDRANKLFDTSSFQTSKIPSPPDDYFLSMVGATHSFVSEFYENRVETEKKVEMTFSTMNTIRRQALKPEEAGGLPPSGYRPQSKGPNWKKEAGL